MKLIPEIMKPTRGTCGGWGEEQVYTQNSQVTTQASGRNWTDFTLEMARVPADDSVRPQPGCGADPAILLPCSSSFCLGVKGS